MAYSSKILAIAIVGTVSSLSFGVTNFVWDFATSGSHDSGSGPFPTSRTFLDNNASVALPVTGWESTVTSPNSGDWAPQAVAKDLYRKYSSGDPAETGLGLDHAFYGNNSSGSPVYSTDHEITPFSFIQLDLQPAKNMGAHNLSFDISSAQSGEGYVLWGSNTAGTPGHFITASKGTPDILSYTVDDATFAQYRYFTISGRTRDDWNGFKQGDDDILLKNGVTAAVPEPASMSVLAIGALGLLRRKKMA